MAAYSVAKWVVMKAESWAGLRVRMLEMLLAYMWEIGSVLLLALLLE